MATGLRPALLSGVDVDLAHPQDGGGPRRRGLRRRPTPRRLSPDRRAALLLVAMESFAPAEAAQVLEISPEELDDPADAAPRPTSRRSWPPTC